MYPRYVYGKARGPGHNHASIKAGNKVRFYQKIIWLPDSTEGMPPSRIAAGKTATEAEMRDVLSCVV